jgi:hypothetical protein
MKAAVRQNSDDPEQSIESPSPSSRLRLKREGRVCHPHQLDKPLEYAKSRPAASEVGPEPGPTRDPQIPEALTGQPLSRNLSGGTVKGWIRQSLRLSDEWHRFLPRVLATKERLGIARPLRSARCSPATYQGPFGSSPFS